MNLVGKLDEVSMKKESVRGVLRQMVRALSAMVKRKSRALKARLIIHSLLSHRNSFLVSSISQKLHPLTSTSTSTSTHQQQAEAEAEAEEQKGSSVIEMVKHSKEEAGEEFCLEQDIDHVADLFIRNFHRQMRMQKQHSLKRYQQMLIDGTL